MGHSAGGQLALCLAAHESSLKRVVSLAGVLDLQQAWEQHLSDNAVVEFLGGKPSEVTEHYREADPMQLAIDHATTQWLIHGAADDDVPSYFSRQYAELKKKRWRGCALHGNLNRRPFRADRSPLKRLAHSRKHGPPPASLTINGKPASPPVRQEQVCYATRIRPNQWSIVKRNSLTPAPSSSTQTQCNCTPRVQPTSSVRRLAHNPNRTPDPVFPD